MEVIKKYKKQIIFHLFLNIAIAIFITFASYYHVPLYSLQDYFIYFIHFLILQFTVFGFIYIISINKYLFYIVFPVFFVVCTIFTYWVYVSDITASESVIQVVFESKLDIAFDLITFPLVGYFIIIITVLIFIIKGYKKIKVNQLKSPLLIIALIGVTVFFIEVYYLNIFKLKSRLPYSITYGISNYFQKEEIVIRPIRNNITSALNNINIIFVLGESVRADHLQINGYKHKTTPYLNANKNVVSYSNIYTPLTYTAISVPQILTNSSIEKDSIKNIYSIYSILNKVNYKTTWIGNQTPEKSYSYFIDENKSNILIDKFRSVLSFHKRKDKDLIPYFKSSFEDASSQFITLHMIGSHWWYENRYSEKDRIFSPVANSKYIPSNTQEEMINSYDNTIYYLDSFLSNVISTINQLNSETLLIYLSDHGEILGENGKWLHAQNDKASQNPAMIIWYSDEFKRAYPDIVSALNENKDKKISTDFFYHSILDLIQVQNFNYDKEKSIFRKGYY